jgi:hypothetical protein
MKALLLALALAGAGALRAAPVAAPGAAGAQSTNARVVFTLKDGSRLIGQVADDALVFEAEMLGRMTLPWERVRSIQWPQNRTNVLVLTRNRDRLQGRLLTTNVLLKTSLGDLTVPVQQLRQVQVESVGGQFDLTRGLLARWSAEGNARDAAGASHGQMLFGAQFAPGKMGQAFRFDGLRSRVFIPDSERLEPEGSFTVAGWVLMSALPPEGGAGIICSRGDNRPGLGTCQLATKPEGRLSLAIWSADNDALVLDGPIAKDRWTHVAGVFDAEAGTLALYLDGAVAERAETKLRPVRDLDGSPDAGWGLGNHEGRMHNWPFEGLLDEFAVWSRALTAEEIQALIALEEAGEHAPAAAE